MAFNLTLEQLTAAVPGSGGWHKALVNILPKYNIDTPQRVAAFLAQCAHESQNFNILEENLNYSAAGLQKTWPKRFPAKLAAELAKQPVRIAEVAYGGRMGNNQPGDGYKFRGQGIIQLTGRDNFTKFGMTLNKSAEQTVDYVATKEGAVAAAGWYWSVNNLNRWVDKNDFDGLSDAINIGRKTAAIGDAHGYDDRKRRYDSILAVLTGKATAKAPVLRVVESEPVVTKPTPVIRVVERAEPVVEPVAVVAEVVAPEAPNMPVLRTLKRGARGALVKKLQMALKTEYIDGVFGDGTETTLKRWQEANNFKVDGVATPEQLFKLFS